MPTLKGILVTASAAVVCVLGLCPDARVRVVNDWGPAAQKQIEKCLNPVGGSAWTR